MSKLLQSNKLIYSLLVSAGILAIGLLLNHNKVAFVVLAIFMFIIDINKHFLITNQLYKDIFKLSGNSGNLSSFAGEKQKRRPAGAGRRYEPESNFISGGGWRPNRPNHPRLIEPTWPARARGLR